MGVCCCLQTCNLVVNLLVMGLVLGKSLMVISTTSTYPVICKSISPLQCIMGVHRCCLHVKYIVYKHFDRLLHIGSSDPT